MKAFLEIWLSIERNVNSRVLEDLRYKTLSETKYLIIGKKEILKLNFHELNYYFSYFHLFEFNHVNPQRKCNIG